MYFLFQKKKNLKIRTTKNPKTPFWCFLSSFSVSNNHMLALLSLQTTYSKTLSARNLFISKPLHLETSSKPDLKILLSYENLKCLYPYMQIFNQNNARNRSYLLIHASPNFHCCLVLNSIKNCIDMVYLVAIIKS